MSLSVPFMGVCACGAIRYECWAEPLMSFKRHCRDCLQASGSADVAGVAVPTSALNLSSGSLTYHSMKADSGNTKHYGFCPECGSPVLVTADEEPDLRIVVVGSLEDPIWCTPTVDMYTASA